METAVPPAPTGIGGWLIVLALIVLAWPLRFIAEISPGLFSPADPMFSDVINAEIACYLILAAFAAFVAFLFFTRRRSFPRFFAILTLVSILVPVMDALSVAAVFSARLETGFVTALDSILNADSVGLWLLAIFGLPIWVLYLRRSRRAANTFVN